MPVVKEHSRLFPCRAIPEGPHEQKLVGLYRQIQEGLWLQRIKVPGGRLTAKQWRTLADLVETCEPETPLHLTTRQDIELHNLRPADISAVQESLAAAGLTCLGAAGDTYRNIVVCPCSGALAGTPDLVPLAARIEAALQAEEGIYALPRKLKVSLSCGRGCGQPFIHGMGFVAVRRDGVWGFRAIGAGSLGAVPQTGIVLREWIPAGDVVPLVLAAVRVFAAHGDRENRRKARLRHVRQRLGDEAFTALIDEAFAEVRAEKNWPASDLSETGAARAIRALVFPNGDVSAEAAAALADLAERDRFHVHVDSAHGVVILAEDEQQLDKRLKEQPALAGLDARGPRVIACPGKRWCRNGIVHTNELADRLRRSLAETDAKDLRICISGCPNGCAHSRVADVGLTGCKTTRDGEKVEAFNIYVGGGMGRDDRLAELSASRVESERAAEHIAATVLRLVEGGNDG